jgi:hypothetical protein
MTEDDLTNAIVARANLPIDYYEMLPTLACNVNKVATISTENGGGLSDAIVLRIGLPVHDYSKLSLLVGDNCNHLPSRT